MDEKTIACGELRGFLEAFARFNDKTNHVYSFNFFTLPHAESVAESVKAWFGGNEIEVTATAVEDWQAIVRGLFGRWLFQFQDLRSDHLADPRRSFSLSDDSGRNAILDWLIATLDKAVRPTMVWSIAVVTTWFYECAWDDLVFDSPEERFLLHLGVSD